MTAPSSRSAVVTVAIGRAAENLDYTFASFARNEGVALHAFILGAELPRRRAPEVTYHRVDPVPDFNQPLREVYFRRMELIDRLDVDYALVVDSYDVLCLQPLPSFSDLLGNADVAACVEHHGSRLLLGQGYTSNFLNCGVVLWNVPRSRDIRSEIVARGRRHCRYLQDDQFCVNEIIQTRHYRRLRILPSQYNYRAYLNVPQAGWPTVSHLNGVLIYHNGPCIDDAKRLAPFEPQARLDELPPDPGALTEEERLDRRLDQLLEPHIVRDSLAERSQLFLLRLLPRAVQKRLLRARFQRRGIDW